MMKIELRLPCRQFKSETGGFYGYEIPYFHGYTQRETINTFGAKK